MGWASFPIHFGGFLFFLFPPVVLNGLQCVFHLASTCSLLQLAFLEVHLLVSLLLGLVCLIHLAFRGRDIILPMEPLSLLDSNGDKSVLLLFCRCFCTPGLTCKRRPSMFYYTFSILCTKAMERGEPHRSKYRTQEISPYQTVDLSSSFLPKRTKHPRSSGEITSSPPAEQPSSPQSTSATHY